MPILRQDTNKKGTTMLLISNLSLYNLIFSSTGDIGFEPILITLKAISLPLT